jgi:glycosyltransferase involved in cell wall biosynthesis
MAMNRILFLVPHPIDDPAYRYRVQQFIPYLTNAGYECTVSPFSSGALFRALRSRGKLATKGAHTLYCTARRIKRLAYLQQFDLIVIHREVFPFFTPVFEKWVLSRNPRVIFTFDDAIHTGHHEVSDLNHPFLYRFKYGRGVNEVLTRSLHVIAGNRILADYARRFNSNVTVIPTVVDCSQYSYKPKCGNERGPVTVGWIGSRTTVRYLPAIEPALKRLAEENPGKVRFSFLGCPEYKPNLPNVTSLPFTVDAELSYLRTLDIGIMPLPDTEWTRGKCAFKAIQYMGMGIPTVASPVGITSDLIAHNVNGLLATSVEEWFQALNLLVNDSNIRVKFSLEARRTIERSYSLQVWGPRLASLFDQLCSDRPTADRPTADGYASMAASS